MREVFHLKSLRPAICPDGLTLQPGRYLVGSANNCDLKLTVRGVEETHCIVIAGPEKVSIKPIDRRTWLNNGPVLDDTLLRRGDRLAIGPAEFTLEKVKVAVPAPVADVEPLKEARTSAEQERTREVLSAPLPDQLRDQAAVKPAPEISEPKPAPLAKKVATSAEGIRELAGTVTELAKDLADNKASADQSGDIERRTLLLKEHLSQLDASFEELRQERAEVNRLVRETERENKLIEQDREEIARRISNLQQAEDEVREELTKVEQERDELRQERQVLAEQHSIISSAQAETERLREEQHQQSNELARERERLAEEWQRLEEQRAVLPAVDTANAGSPPLDADKIEQQLQELASRENELHQRDEELSKREAELDDQQESLRITDDEQLLLQRRLDEQLAAVDTEQSANYETRGALDQQREKLAQKFETFQADRQRLAEERDAFEGRLRVEEEKLTGERTHLENERATLEEAQQELQKIQDELTAEREQLVAEKSEFDSQLEQFEAEQTAFREETKLALSEQQSEADASAEADRKKLESREQELKTREQELASREEELKSREASFFEHKENVSAQAEELNTREAELAQRGEELNQREEAFAAREESLAVRESELSKQSSGIEQQLAAIALRETAIGDQEQSFVDTSNQHDERTAELDALANELNEQRQSLDEQRAQLETEREQLALKLEQFETEREQFEANLNSQDEQNEEQTQSEESLTAREQELEVLSQDLAERESALEARHAELAVRDEEFAAREEELRGKEAELQSREQEWEACALHAERPEEPAVDHEIVDHDAVTEETDSIADELDALQLDLEPFEPTGEHLEEADAEAPEIHEDSVSTEARIIDDIGAVESLLQEACKGDSEESLPVEPPKPEEDDEELNSLRNTLAEMFDFNSDSTTSEAANAKHYDAASNESVKQQRDEAPSCPGAVPEPDDAPQIQVPGTTAAVAEPTQAPAEEPAEEADSVASYMEGLLARMRGEQPPAPAAPKPVAEAPKPQSTPQESVDQTPELNESESTPEPYNPAEPPQPKHRINKDELRATTDSFRMVANQSARKAIAHHAVKKNRTSMMVKTIVTVIAFCLGAFLCSTPFWFRESFLLSGIASLICSGVVAMDLYARRKQMLCGNTDNAIPAVPKSEPAPVAESELTADE
ncbi:Chromosome partition protein Smc [Calycomorphotria hydatis]|uniref:Chromosome partition protein Smc n=2 Tax=Calycomorphotria hydatis TaxID=2528027 RepID=A0A517T3N6_9PLAN|nr:Chromosome partition protein Smc [Calycomorphotria hydatis]